MVEAAMRSISLKYRRVWSRSNCEVIVCLGGWEALHLATMISSEKWLLLQSLPLANSNDNSYKERNDRTLVLVGVLGNLVYNPAQVACWLLRSPTRLHTKRLLEIHEFLYICITFLK